MELHSYAKRKTSKKWTVHQKRRLVETRISYDVIFTNQPRNSMIPWKKVLGLAKLDDFSVFFVRKQWSSMVAKYKQYKQNRLGNIPTQSIDDDTIRKISEEWEFFYPIHRFMTGKTTNLHSYAQKVKAEPNDDDDHHQQQQQHQHQQLQQQQPASNETTQQPVQPAAEQLNNSASSTERFNVFSSDTNEDYATVNVQSESLTQNTDHDFYTKKSATEQYNYFADVSEDTHESMTIELISLPQHHVGRCDATEHTAHGVAGAAPAPATATNSKANTKTHHLSERDKYYRHKRRFNRRLERRFDSLLNVFGQIVKAEYPNIDVSPLKGTALANTNLVSTAFSSSEDDASDSSEPEQQTQTQTQPQHQRQEEQQATPDIPKQA